MGIKHIVLVIKTEAEEFKDGNEEATGKKKQNNKNGRQSASSHISRREKITLQLLKMEVDLYVK